MASTTAPVEVSGLAEAKALLQSLADTVKNEPWLMRLVEDVILYEEGALFEMTNIPGEIGLKITPTEKLLNLIDKVKHAQ